MDVQGRILIADDEEIYLQSTTDLLTGEGYIVDCARDAFQATLLLEKNIYDLIISDILMPGNSELNLIKQIHGPNAGLPVILVTGYPTAQTAIQAIDLNVLTYLVKPVEFQDLLDRVKEGVKQRGIQRAILDSSRRVRNWADEMSELATGLGKVHPTGAISVQQMLGVALGRMGETLLDLKHLADLSSPQIGVEQHICPVKQCPRLELYERVIKEGIAILERTKGSFKSRELGDLRQRMELTVDQKT